MSLATQLIVVLTISVAVSEVNDTINKVDDPLLLAKGLCLYLILGAGSNYIIIMRSCDAYITKTNTEPSINP